MRDMTGIFPDHEYPVYEPDPLRERVLLALANADLQDWPEIDHNTTRHTAEMMYGSQADAVISLFNELLTARIEGES
jgi:hypothetical protein